MAKESIGALWRKQTQKGEVLSGVITVGGQQVRIAVWQNSYKKEPKQPDLRIFVDDYEPGNNQQPAANNQPEPNDGLPF